MTMFDARTTSTVYPELRGLFASAWLDSFQENESTGDLGRMVVERELSVGRDLANFRIKIGDFVDFLKASASLTGSVEVDRWIDFFFDIENRIFPELASIVEKHFAAVRKNAASDKHDLHRFLDRYIAGFRNHHAELLTICRDARWELMAYRAEHQPSIPAGPIQGESTDLDAYLATLD